MMNWIWFLLIAVSVLAGIADGKINNVSQAALGGACDSITLFITLLGGMCLWSGVMKIADSCGITRALAKLLAPVTKRLFPDIAAKGAGMEAICMNMAANFLGLGNAATPFGLKAMKEMSAASREKGTATDSMAMFIVINTASLQLIPTTIALLRLKMGAKMPFDVMPCIWLSSITTLIFGIMMAKILAGRKKSPPLRSGRTAMRTG